jgi:integrase/recombinase XerC
MNKLQDNLDFWPSHTAHKDFEKNPPVETAIAPGCKTDASAAQSPDISSVDTVDATAVVRVQTQPLAVRVRTTVGSQDRELEAAAMRGGADSLAFWAALYLRDKVQGGSPNTLDAKTRDLARFVRWFTSINGLCDMRAWRTRDTQAYLRELGGSGLAASSINRAFATLRHFARWAHDKYGVFGAMGLPTAEIRELVTEEPACKKLDRGEVHALFKSAEERVVLSDAKRRDALGTGQKDAQRRARPRRDLAMLALLYYTGLRATELVMLKREQYTGSHLHNVARKGHNRSRKMYVPIEARRYLNDYLQHERPYDDKSAAVPLFLATRSGGYMRREYLGEALRRIAEDASKHRKTPIELHPHRLRHTFGARHREASGSDTETAQALGHQSLKYVGRYVRKTDTEREALIEQALDI